VFSLLTTIPYEFLGASVSAESLIELIEKGIKLYNERRAPEAVAELIRVEEDTVIVSFSGSFCMWCGIYDWVEDLVYIFREIGLETRLVKFVEPEDPAEPRRFGYFKIVSASKN